MKYSYQEVIQYIQEEDDSIEIINIHGKGYKLITPEGE